MGGGLCRPFPAQIASKSQRGRERPPRASFKRVLSPVRGSLTPPSPDPTLGTGRAVDRSHFSRRNVASCGSARDSARGLQLITGVWPRFGRLPAARRCCQGTASAISFCTRRNRAARSPCVTTVSSLGHVQI